MNNQKIKLIIFHPYSLVGGADLSISTLINNLDHRRYSIDLICIKRSKNAETLSKNIKIYKIKANKTIFSIFKFRKIIKKNLSEDYKKVILFSNQNFANIISYFATLNLDPKLKKIAIERNHINELDYYFSIKDFVYKITMKILMKLIYKKFDKIICNSNESSKDLAKFLNKEVMPIHNPIKIAIKNKVNNKIKNRNTKNCFKILNIGRLENQKDHITLIKAVNILKNKINFKLNIVGYGTKYKDIKKLIENLKLNKEIKIYRNIRNPWKYFKNTDLFILSSLYEGFPNVIIESILNNTPLLSSNCKSGPKEILNQKHGPNLFNAEDFNDLAKKIYKHFKNPKILIDKNKVHIKNLHRFDKKKIISKYNNLFKKI
tara:strand:- start:24 stop:1148 length:1125 start_codon:yes stop_codon:yes gene_type:complete